MITSKSKWTGVFDTEETLEKRGRFCKMTTDALFDLLESRLDAVEAELKKVARLRANSSPEVMQSLIRGRVVSRDGYAGDMYNLQRTKETLEAQWDYLQEDEHDSYYVELSGEAPNIYIEKPVSITVYKEQLTEDGYGIVSETVDGTDFVNILVDIPANKVLNILDSNFTKLIDSVEEKNREYRACKCKSCGEVFPVSREEDRWMRNKGLVCRVRCSKCVEERKRRKGRL